MDRETHAETPSGESQSQRRERERDRETVRETDTQRDKGRRARALEGENVSCPLSLMSVIQGPLRAKPGTSKHRVPRAVGRRRARGCLTQLGAPGRHPWLEKGSQQPGAAWIIFVEPEWRQGPLLQD